MQSEPNAFPATKSGEESLLPELLHALSQPLRSLPCSLELTLLQPRDSEEYRKRLRESLGLTEEITVLTCGIRELVEAERPGNDMRELAFDAMLRTTVRELLPLADQRGVELSLLCAPSLAVVGDPDQFSKALVYLLDFALSLSCGGDEIQVQAQSDGAAVDCRLEVTGGREPTPKASAKKCGKARSYLHLLIARRIFEVAGGTVLMERTPVGERGREVREFLEGSLGEEGRQRSVVIVSTSDQSQRLRIRAALSATAIAEYFCARGKHVLLVVDSLTRLAMAQREISLAAGEPPTAKGYTPSVFALLARLIERAGNFPGGSITAFYTVLMEGDDEQDPLVDGARALLDGHVMLDRRLAAQGHYPPISILDSVSRLMPAVCTTAHLEKARELRHLLASYKASEDLIRIGAYQKGADVMLDRAVALIPELNHLLRQAPSEGAPLQKTVEQLLALST